MAGLPPGWFGASAMNPYGEGSYSSVPPPPHSYGYMPPPPPPANELTPEELEQKAKKW